MKIPQNRQVLWLVAALVAAPLSATGPNLLVNPGFTTSFAGWENSQGHASWVAADAHTDPHSGALREIDSIPNSVEYQTQCIPVTGGVPYVARVFSWVEGAADSTGVLELQYLTDCSSNAPLSTFNSVPNFASGWNELHAAGTSPAGAHAVRVLLLLTTAPTGGPVTAYWDDAYFGTGTCLATATTLCLNNGRFKVTARYDTGPQKGDGKAVPFADDSGSFWFFDADNVELDVKVLNACGVNNRYWVFAAGLTNVGVTLTVTDTAQPTLTQRVYTNAVNRTYKTITDTDAFATCP